MNLGSKSWVSPGHLHVAWVSSKSHVGSERLLLAHVSPELLATNSSCCSNIKKAFVLKFCVEGLYVPSLFNCVIQLVLLPLSAYVSPEILVLRSYVALLNKRICRSLCKNVL